MPETKGQIRKADVAFIRAEIDTNSINKDTKTFDVVFATENPILRNYWWAEEKFYEVLVCDRRNMVCDRLDGGLVPLLDTHNNYSITNQYGIERNWKIENKECRATIEYTSQTQKQDLWPDIENKVIRNVSVWPRILKYERIPNAQDPINGIPTYRAVLWEAMEISLCPVQVDSKSSTRSEDANTHEIEILNYNIQNRSNMEKNVEQQIRDAVRAAGLEEAFADGLIGRADMTLETATAEIANKRGGTPAPVVAPVAPQAPAPVAPQAPAADGDAGTRAVTAERERVASINTIAGKYQGKLERSFIDGLVGKQANGGFLTVDEARMAILEKLAESDVNISGGGASVRSQDIRDTNVPMVEALMERAQPGSVQRFYNLDTATKGRGLSEAGKDFRFMSMVDMCRAICQKSGVSVAGLSKEEVVKRAMSTTDMPDLFTSTVKRFMRMDYETYVPDWERFSQRVPADDFRVKTGIKVDSAVTFEEIAENGEYKESNVISNEKATIQLKTYGRRFSISRKTIINDDLGVLARMPRIIALGYRQFQSKKAWALVTGNALCPDGKSLFHADHGNLGTAALIGDSALSAARTAMRRQTSPEGNELMITPKFLMVPPELETKAQKLLKPIYPGQVADVNLWSSLDPFVNVYFADTTAWYMVADPNMISADGMVHAFLDGQEGLYTESFINQDNDALVIKARGDFDCAMWGWQGWYKNPGAAEGSVD
jgi:hypothetical protein